MEALQYFFVACSFLIALYPESAPALIIFLCGVAIFFSTILTIMGNETLQTFHEEIRSLSRKERQSMTMDVSRRDSIKNNINPVLLNMIISVFSIALIFQDTYAITYWKITYWLLFVYSLFMLISIFSKRNKRISDMYIIIATGLFMLTSITLLLDSIWKIIIV